MKCMTLLQAPTLSLEGRFNPLAEWMDGLPSDLIEQDAGFYSGK